VGFPGIWNPISPTTDKLKSTDKLKPEHITVFQYVKILRGCIVASLVLFFTKEATIHPLRILTYRKTVMCSGFNLSVDFSLSGVGDFLNFNSGFHEIHHHH
jgi:hypothetical protein